MDLEYKITSKSEADTIVLAQNIESEKFSGMVICLNGELGTGKTVFTKGFADALEIDEVVTSPTFSIIKEYLSGEMPLYHMDMYRLEGNIKSTGILDYFDRDGIVIIEWADMIKDYLPEERLDIYFKAIDEDTRVIKLIPYGTKYEELCEDILS
jgi:tRNA threonylcarbamoyladenosine biosynthesis protein TsaE